MKVFLMYKNKDFNIKQNLPYNSDILMNDLELEVLINAMSCKDDFLSEISKKTILYSLKSKEEILYRQEILKDCLKNPNIIKEIYNLTIKAIAKKQEKWFGIFGKYPTSLLSSSVSLLDMYFELLKELRKIVDENTEKFDSAGFKRFFSMIQKELDDSYLKIVKKHLKELRFKKGVLISARLSKINEDSNYTLRKNKTTKKNWINKIFAKKSKEYTCTLHPRDDAGAKVLRSLKDESLNNVANYLSNSATHIDNFFISLRIELAFYMGCINLNTQLQNMGYKWSYPKIAPKNSFIFLAKELSDISLALILNKKIASNDIEAINKKLFMITGANQGGKTTFLRSIGLAQIMMQCGMFVLSSYYKTTLCSGIFTHFKKEEDKNIKSGKFDEELSRMSNIIDHISPNALILFNESFSSTNEAEGSQIAQQIIEALIQKNIKIFFVTHMYELANYFYKKKIQKTLFLRANRDKNGNRNFKIIKAPPLQTSFAKDIYDTIFTKTH